MLLRRITKHVHNQNWFAVFLDFIIVVVGVFIGIQVNNWNEQRKDLADSRVYLKRLQHDIKTSVDTNNDRIKTQKNHVKNIETALEAFQTCRVSEADEKLLLTGIYMMGKYNLPEMIMGTIDELNATGKYELVGNQEIRNLLTESIRTYEGVLALDKQLTDRSIASINYVRTKFFFNFKSGLFNSRTNTIKPDQVEYSMDELCGDRQVRNALGIVIETMMYVNRFTLIAKDKQIETLQLIDQEINKYSGDN